MLAMGMRTQDIPFQATYYLKILVFLLSAFALILFYGYCLSLAGIGESTTEALQLFIKARIEHRSWSPAEIRGITIFCGAIVLFAVVGSVTVVKGLSWWKRWQRVKFVKDRYASAQGTSEWVGISELKPLMGEDGVILGTVRRLGRLTPVRLAERYSCEHIAVIGPTGCGKSTCFFMPNLLALPNGISVVATDPKGELEAQAGAVLRRRGWQVWTFAPFEPSVSMGYDPLRTAQDASEIADMAEIILRNGYTLDGQASDTQWIGFSVPLLEAVLYAARQQYDTGGTVGDAVSMVTSMTERQRAEIMKKVGGLALDRYLTYMQSLESPETAGSIRTVLSSAARVFQRPDIVEVSRREPINFRALRERPVALFVRIPERKAHLLKALMATFFWQMLEHIADVGVRPVYFFLDEFPNIGKIPGFAGMAATLRSRRIALCLGLQGVEQLAREYSDREQQDILNNLKTKVYFPGLSGESGRYVSDTIGYATVKERDAAQRVKLLTPAELRTIPEGKILVVTRNLQPVLLDVLHYSKLRFVA